MSLRRAQTKEVKIESGESASTPINIDGFAFGAIFMPSVLTGSNYAIEVWDFAAEAWIAPSDSEGTALAAIPHADSSTRRLPDTLFAWRRIRFVSDGTEAATRTISLDLKS